MLKITNLHVFYGGIHALQGIDLEVAEGKIVTLIGANGAGKSTTLRSISGLVQPKAGVIHYKGQDVGQLGTKALVENGLVLVPEGRRIFPNLTVTENLMLGAYHRKDADGVQKDLHWVFELFPRLKERSMQKAGTMSGGEQQMLAIGRALMSKPQLLMMDEPSLGLAPILVQELFEIIKEIHRQGCTILLIEQNAFAALRVADDAYVLETGRVVMSGRGAELLANPEVRKAYLGA